MTKSAQSARGEIVNFDRLIQEQGDTVAIGNMRMNARGEKLGPDGKPIRKPLTTADQVKLAQEIRQQTMSLSDASKKLDLQKLSVPRRANPALQPKKLEAIQDINSAIVEIDTKFKPMKKKKTEQEDDENL